MNILNLSGKNLSHWLKSILVSVTVLLTGCSCLSTPVSKPSQTLHVSVSELSQYWIVKDGVLDWSMLFQDQIITGDFTAKFTINSQGEIQLMDLMQISASFKADELQLEIFSRQSFIATKDNYSSQAVSVTARVMLN
ncbi:hypothetical protein Sps_03226 [Shewanella psychrophila]|uniref:Uncharacterized protein n=1 Tax=Shewanella psychrophila TaxID=225848 RepID=A0A1S6HSA4_9GAMM|nr:hypothetical protein [Shewanella psychrophila]AQS38368.1 hypothetical protein Sps_03226 [Shewanella psychrophila]